MLNKWNIFFIVLNILLLILWFFSLKYWLFSKIDNYTNSKILSIYHSSYKWNIVWENNVTLLKIDKKFFDKMWVTTSTFHRWYYAKLLKKLQSYWVKNIIFDVYFWNLKYGTWNTKLQKIYNKSLKIFDNRFTQSLSWNITMWVLPYKNNILLPSEKFIKKWVNLWYVKSHTNKLWINDWIIPYIKYKTWYIFNLWIAWYLNKLYLEWKINKEYKIKFQKNNNIFSPNFLNIITSNKKYNLNIPLSKDNNWKYFYFTPLLKLDSSNKSLSIYDIISDNDNIYKDILKNKTIFIWATDETLNDIKLSYLWNIPWVMFHINTYFSLIWKNYIYVLPYLWSFIILLILFIIWYIFIVTFKSEKLSLITFLVFIFLLYASSTAIIISKHILIPIWSIIIILTIKVIIDILHILTINETRKKYLNTLFNKYVWEKVLEEKDRSWIKEKLAEKKEIAIMFSDIKSFTNISEKLTPQEVIEMLNIYFEKTNTPLWNSNWFIDKYVWDAIMAFWDNVKNTDKILNAIINIQKIHPKIIKDVEQHIWKKIDIYTRIWLHLWEAIIWDVWDKNNKMSYTAIWDNVNLASRLEWINKYYWTNIMISESFYKKIKEKKNFAIRLMDKITVKWKSQPIKIYHVFPKLYNEITPELKEYIKSFEIWLDFYFKWDFKQAKEEFEKLEIFKLWKLDPTLKIFLERIDYMIKNPPENWDGVCKFEVK